MSRQTPPIKRKTSIIVIMFSTKKEELKISSYITWKLFFNSYINFMISSLEFSHPKEDNENLSQKNKEVTNEERNKIKLSYILPNKCNEY